ncbi:MAG: sigma-70 family RNA polymerase sigma factor [Phycisphaeraceae bacterium]|nr:sigma-70 family RNA polymerase sigma factor [Phycisphaeraceae bacterium]MCB9848312.1 sigma-70 family RNA polymerase sigma factor [Phycisphaeraceae bacterium]
MNRATHPTSEPPPAAHDDRREAVYDQWLVLRSQGGDAEAFAQLVRRWSPRLLRHARRLLDTDADARDAAQDAWLSITGALNRLNDPATFRRWAYRIVTRRCADHLRRAQRQRRTDTAAAVPEAAPIPDEHHDEIDRLRAAIRALPAERRVVLSLLYVDGLTTTEIASVLEIPTGTVKSRLRLARDELRRTLDPHSDSTAKE